MKLDTLKLEDNPSYAAALARNEIIPHPPNDPVLLLRQSFIDICDGNHAAAHLLSVFEQLTAEAEAEADGWISRTYDDLLSGLLHHCSRAVLAAALRALRDRGYISSRERPGRGDRYERMDRTLQYRLHVPAVIAALQARGLAPAERLETAA